MNLVILTISLQSCVKFSQTSKPKVYPKIWWGDKEAIRSYLNETPYMDFMIHTKDYVE
jgi:hypothetical protein